MLSIAIENKDWPPHYRWIDGEPVGPDPEIVTEILDQLGYGVRFRPAPWKRAINLVLSARVDALLDLTTTPERRERLYYPETHLTREDAVLWVAHDSPLEAYPGAFESLIRAEFGVVGVMRGVARNRALAEIPGITLVRYDDWETLLEGLITERRLDVAIGYRAATAHHANEAGLRELIRPLDPPLETVTYYLGFSKKPGHEQLARDFSDALAAFKASPAWREVNDRYGVLTSE